jgi:hypothetical protein
MEVEWLTGKRHVAATERRTGKDWALQIKQMLDERYSWAIKAHLVMDNLNTQRIASLYETFKPMEARRLAVRLDRPLRTKTRQLVEHDGDRTERPKRTSTVDQRIPDTATMQTQITAWERERNDSIRKTVRQFATPGGRIKLKRLYRIYRCYVILGKFKAAFPQPLIGGVGMDMTNILTNRDMLMLSRYLIL